MRIIIADDEELVRFSVRDMLDELPVPVTVVGEARNGIQLIEACRALAPDVAIVDVRMPSMNGLDAIDMLREESPQIDWIVLTSYAEFEYARRALEAGADEYLLKPVGPDDLKAALERVAARRIARWAAENERFENRIVARLTGAGERSEEPAAWVYSLVLLELDGSASAGPLGALKDALAGSIKKELTDLLGPSTRTAVTSLGPRSLAAVLGLRTLPGKAVAAGPLAERFEARIVRTARSFTAGGRAATVIVVENASTLDELAALAGRATRVAELRPLLGFGEAVNATELEGLASLGRCREAAASLSSAAGAWSSHSPLAFEQALRGARELVRGEPRLRKPRIERTIERYLATLVSPRAGRLEALEEWLPALLEAALLDDASRFAGQPAGAAVAQVLAYLEEHYARNVSIAEIAASLELTPNYLSALFHRKVGVTFSQYLTRLRMDRARDLLAGGDRTVREVAGMVGYTSPRHFARLFRGVFHRYPSELTHPGRDVAP